MKIADQTVWWIAHATSADRLRLGLLIATIVHAIVIFGVGFGSEPNKPAPSLDVILLSKATHRAPQKADYLAQAASQASGAADAKLQPGSPFTSQAAMLTVGEAPIATKPKMAAQLERVARKLLVQTRADHQVLMDLRRLQEAVNADESTASLDSKLARLSSALADEAQRYAQRPRVRFLESVSAKSAVEAAYIKGWIDRVERVGNLNYPDEALSRELSGRLILHVLLNDNGDIAQVFVGSSSGHQVLDAAALRIVRLAGPFEPFSRRMRQAFGQLMITRTWIFASHGKVSTR